MVPHVAQRGTSFQGASAYYLNDKQANTNERVAWTYTHNLPTMDAGKGFNYMASTAMQAEVLKHRAGIPTTGRKSNAKPVYSFSLSWHPEQQPDQSTMQKAALDVLAHLGLTDHEAVFVAHNDEPHSHVHVIANLVHPETGKTASMSYDHLTMSAWAEEFEQGNGKIYCEQRVENNKERRENAKEGRQLKLVKHKEKRLERAALIQSLYKQADSTKAFQAALEHNGYTLAMGHKGRVVLVNQDGDIFALSRQLEGQRAKDIRERLDNLNSLPKAQTIADERKYFMRDDYETKRQKMIVDAAIEDDKHKQEFNKSMQTSLQLEQPEKLKPYQSYADELDKLRAKEYEQDRKHMIKENQLRRYYNREAYIKRLETLKQQFDKTILPWQKQHLSKEIENLERSLKTVDQRMQEQGIAPENPVYKGYNSTLSEEQTPTIELSKEFKTETQDRETLERINQIRQRRSLQNNRSFER